VCDRGETRTWRVTIDGTGDAATVQAAIDSSASGDTILVGPGHFTWSNQGGGTEKGFIRVMERKHHITLRSETGPDATILDAEYRNRTIYVQGMNHITVEGFTITGGQAPPFGDHTGGGYFNHISGDTISNCTFLNNEASYGGAIYSCGNGYVTLVENCTFSGNSASVFGGAIALCCNSASSVIRDCAIRDNSAVQNGGAISFSLCPLTVEGCIISDNTAGARGGGIACYNNSAAAITRCTVARNEAPDGAGICIHGNSSLAMHRSILAFNWGGWLSFEQGPPAVIGCNDIFGNTAGDEIPPGVTDEGFNIFLDPQFCGTPGSGNYYLQSDSPCLPFNHPAGLFCQLVGALPDGCGATGNEKRSWGKTKARFR
jgi:predicted outer membrane repeat protein